MPFFRGIEISIQVSLETKQLHEYPHPDGSSVRLLKGATCPINGAHAGASRAPQSSTQPTAEDLDPTRLKKVNPRISVYVPSLPGEQFWLRYLITQSPPPSRYIFFKMTINGHHISSWGVNTSTQSTGTVVRALYQPEEKWGDTRVYNEAGYPGIETRYFHFMSGLGEKSAAEDGGLVEVQVFRCKGRKRIALELNTYRNQERYGITSPSGGLVDNPEDATYYNYYLVDAKDAPYATFCFHYRSMKYLRQLSIVPQAGLDLSLIPGGPVHEQQEQSKGTLKPEHTPRLSRRPPFNAGAIDSRVFDDNVGTTETSKTDDADVNSQEVYFLNSPPERLPASARGAVTDDHHEASERSLIDVRQRPLPDIPRSLRRPASASSLRSNCPSLTPSLRHYVESDDFENEEIKLSVAQPMLISSESTQSLEVIDTVSEERMSFSDYASSPSSTEASRSAGLPSPTSYIPTTGSVLERHLTQYDSLITMPSPTKAENVSSSTVDSPMSDDRTESRTGTFDLSESEWLRQTPSPLDDKGKQTDDLLSPRPEPRTEGAAGAPDDAPGARAQANGADHAPVGD